MGVVHLHHLSAQFITPPPPSLLSPEAPCSCASSWTSPPPPPRSGPKALAAGVVSAQWRCCTPSPKPNPAVLLRAHTKAALTMDCRHGCAPWAQPCTAPSRGGRVSRFRGGKVPLGRVGRDIVQGYLTHNKTPNPLWPPFDPRHRTTAGS